MKLNTTKASKEAGVYKIKSKRHDYSIIVIVILQKVFPERIGEIQSIIRRVSTIAQTVVIRYVRNFVTISIK